MKKILCCLVMVILIPDNIGMAACPTPAVTYSWPHGIPVTYSFATYVGAPAFTHIGASGLGVTSDIDYAYNLWSYANQNQNSSNVTFYNSTTGFNRIYVVSVNSPGVPGLDPGVAANYTLGLFSGTSNVAVQDITLYYGSISIGGLPNYSSGAGLGPFITKVMLHEVGHAMGLTDQPLGSGACGGQTAGQSVMNATCGTNDSAGNLPTSVQSCDNASI
ncbi:MAG TPA: hypothetical protein VFQ91_27170 [Bryobacteraceae bacterium]|nr:hypothetical protein [Bryobacteraceae bacterium]